jgi:4-amino-4-deoxy-L-arabinose transferase-like glycosyltransferase
MKPYAALAGVVILAALFWGALTLKTFRTLGSPDQLDYAHLGRNIIEGRGFNTNIIFPIYITRFPTLVDHPEFSRAPGYPVLLAAAEAVLGKNDWAVISVSGLAYILTVGLAYLFAERLFGSQRIALVAALVVLLNQEIVNDSQTGLADPVFAFWLTLILFLVYTEKPAWLVGISIALGYLLRYNLLMMVPGLVLFWWWVRPQSGWKYVAIVFGVALLVVTPWLIRNFGLTGSPTFTWPVHNYVMGTSVYPAQELYRMIERVDIMQFALSHPGEMIRKSIDGARLLYNDLPTVTSFIISAFFVVALLVKTNKDRRALVLQYAVLAMIVFQAVALIPFEHERIRLFHAFIPLMCIYAVQLLDAQLSSFALPKWAQVVGLTAMVMWVAIPTLPEFTGQSYRGDFVEPIDDLKSSTTPLDPDAVFITDQPWALTWYMNKTTVNMPARYDDLVQIESLTDKPVYVFFFYVNERDRYNRADEYNSQYFENDSFLANHRLAERFEDGSMLYVLER